MHLDCSEYGFLEVAPVAVGAVVAQGVVENPVGHPFARVRRTLDESAGRIGIEVWHDLAESGDSRIP
ncbi:MAG: hypothetical protein M5U09_01500 [Gammaproteobacteria bacterium]|nr:hypothetical protein [Gammaproteobacteria bacterium]